MTKIRTLAERIELCDLYQGEMDISLEVGICAEARTYRVTFEGPNADQMAYDFAMMRRSTHTIHNVNDSESVREWAHPLTYELLNPVCEHNLSAWSCYGPDHYDD